MGKVYEYGSHGFFRMCWMAIWHDNYADRISWITQKETGARIFVDEDSTILLDLVMDYASMYRIKVLRTKFIDDMFDEAAEAIWERHFGNPDKFNQLTSQSHEEWMEYTSSIVARFCNPSDYYSQ